MPVPESGALLQIILQFMRQINTQMASVSNDLKGLAQDGVATRERLIRIEEQGLVSEVQKLKLELATLQTEKNEREGARKFFEFWAKHGITLLVIVAGITAFILKGKI